MYGITIPTAFYTYNTFTNYTKCIDTVYTVYSLRDGYFVYCRLAARQLDSGVYGDKAQEPQAPPVSLVWV